MFVYSTSHRNAAAVRLYCWWATFQSSTSVLQSDNMGHVMQKLSLALCEKTKKKNGIIVIEISFCYPYFTLFALFNFACFGSFDTIHAR